ncbi:hypothetical protein [Halosimplex pelagicum]|uniref:Uncharacterized protein n=1 Tax=Halosimplex pelagicum TaxID=869886 RepID=A0A7D5P8U1_9EURY|nr:hypothetical protein [Halosimplex pelagicum]QLH80262.1 hypothetical protein HZS54_00870 [Halosimplex pelagicum]
MSKSEPSTPAGPERSATPRLSFRAGSDRGCPHCGDVALAFDPSADRARCRSCGEAA